LKYPGHFSEKKQKQKQKQKQILKQLKIMKTMKLFRIMAIPAIVAIGLILSLANCKKPEKEIVTETVYVPVHDTTIVTINVTDTVNGKNITGACTYPDYTGALLPAKGAVLSLYSGTSATGTPVLTAFSDQSGNYSLKYLVPGSYFLTALYNTENQNKGIIQGVNFAFDGIGITMGTSDLSQNIALASVAAPGALKISLDSVSAGATYRQVAWESHSKVVFNVSHSLGTVFQGGFNVWKVSKFNFDEANPANIVISAWVQTSSINTLEPARDALAGGCVRKTLNVDTMIVGGVVKPIPETDTIRFYANVGEVTKYGKGYLAKGHLKGFYKHGTGVTGPGAGTNGFLPADTAGYAGPYNQVIDKPCDMYFEFQGKNKVISGSNYNWYFLFESKFTFLKSEYSLGGSTQDAFEVTPHIQLKGTTNKDY